MLPLSLSVSLSKDEDFIERVVAGFNVVAHEVLNENSEVDHAPLRSNHANMILQVPANTIRNYVDGVIGSPTIQNSNPTNSSDITDEQILDGIRSVWNGLIGISPDVNGG